MKYGIMGAVVPMLMKKTSFVFLDKAVPGIDPSAVKKEYKAIISRQPEIGGSRNNLIMGLYLAAYFLAVYKVAPDKLNDAVFKGYVDAVCVSDLFVKMNKGREFFTEKNMSTRNRLQSDPDFNSYPENWKYTFSYDMDVPECTITYTKCAICNMARREGCFHLMKALCTTDFAQQELMGNILIRTKTIGNGDEICDFHIIGQKKEARLAKKNKNIKKAKKLIGKGKLIEEVAEELGVSVVTVKRYLKEDK